MMLAILAAIVTACALGKFAYDYFRTKRLLTKASEAYAEHKEDEGERIVKRGLDVITRQWNNRGYKIAFPDIGWQPWPEKDAMVVVLLHVKSGSTMTVTATLKEIAAAMPMHPDVGNRKQRRALRSMKRAST